MSDSEQEQEDEFLPEDLVMKEWIGSGSYGDVYKAILKDKIVVKK
jgi:hypothetical protein